LTIIQNGSLTLPEKWAPPFVFGKDSGAGLPDFPLFDIPKRRKKYQIATKVTNGLTIYQMAVIYAKWPINIPFFFFPRHSKIYPNLDFWFENIPSGNPVLEK
jgi:hypothetical protein